MTLLTLYDPNDDGEKVARGVDGNLSLADLAHERNSGTSNQFGVGVPECTVTRADVGQTETLITNAPCLVFGLIGNDGNTGDSVLRDAAAVSGGSTPVINAQVGEGVSTNLFGAKFNNGLTIVGDDAAHDVTVFWRAQD